MKFGPEEVHPRPPALPAVRRSEDRRMRVRYGEEKGQGQHFEDGSGVPTMSVSIKPGLAQRKDTATDQTPPNPTHSTYQQKEEGEHYLSFRDGLVALISVWRRRTEM